MKKLVYFLFFISLIVLYTQARTLSPKEQASLLSLQNNLSKSIGKTVVKWDQRLNNYVWLDTETNKLTIFISANTSEQVLSKQEAEKVKLAVFNQVRSDIKKDRRAKNIRYIETRLSFLNIKTEESLASK